MTGNFLYLQSEMKTPSFLLLNAIRSRCETGPNLFIFALLIFQWYISILVRIGPVVKPGRFFENSI